MGMVLQHLVALLIFGFFIFVIWYGRSSKKDEEQKKCQSCGTDKQEAVAASSVGEVADEVTKRNDELHEYQLGIEKSLRRWEMMHEKNKSRLVDMMNAEDIITYRLREGESIPILMSAYSDLPFRQMIDARQNDKQSYFEMILFAKYKDYPPEFLRDIAALAVQHYGIGVRECLQYLLQDLRRTKRSMMKKNLRSLDDYGVAVDADEE